MTTLTLENLGDKDFLIAAPGEPIVNITAYTARQQVRNVHKIT